jgi:hypothetical protein
VSQNVHVDLAASTLELTVHGSLHVAETVERVLEQSRKARTVQPIITEPSVSLRVA